jgi:catalase
MAVKFLLPGGEDTDIVSHSYDGFPAGTPENFLDFLRAAGSADPSRMKNLAAAQPAVRAFLAAPKPAPASYATERFFGVSAFRFENAAGETRHGRYRLEPVDGAAHLDSESAARQAPDYLARGLVSRLASGPVRFRLLVQLAAPEDDVADGSVPWPHDRPTIEAGTISIERLVPNGDALQRTLLFTPLNLVGGIAPSADPMLPARNRAYRISHERRTRSAVSEPRRFGAIP